MEYAQFKENMVMKMEALKIDAPESKIRDFYFFSDILVEENQKYNLTTITEQEEVINKHFIDSIIIESFIKNESKIIDVGTGAGFPGLPLKIIREDIDITLLDSLSKRIGFINKIITELKLNKIEAIHGRAEDMAQNKKWREQYDVAVSRAVANLSTLVEYMIPFVKVGGKCICMKGNEVETEVNEAKKAIVELGGEIEEIVSLKLPFTDINRNIIIIKKIKNTNSKYPRKAGTPSKNPIK
jgi:16S rRNA (guanine527-N7)-methyltransferase